MNSRREFITQVSLAAAGYALLPQFAKAAYPAGSWDVPKQLQEEMYQAALNIAKKNVRGGPNEPVYKKPYVDAAFNGDIFLWDTCFMACYGKYHPKELPVANALDNFYDRQEPDGFICREYTKQGKPMWQKDHPVSINPPLFAFAELELYSQSKDLDRLKKAYPHLKKFLGFLIKTYRMDDHLFYSDAMGSGMDNIPRYPDGWKDDGKGIPVKNLHPEVSVYKGLSTVWNRQGRSVDMSAQMALFAENLVEIAKLIGKDADVPDYQKFYDETKDAINKHCWNEQDGFYYDLGYGKQIKRMHIGMFWTLMAGVVPKDRVNRVVAVLTDPKKFWRKFPVASYAADQKEYKLDGKYWLSNNWPPMNYMVIKGLQRVNKPQLAEKLARQYYWGVAQVYLKTKTFWEDYAPDAIKQGSPSVPNFCGWTAIVPITLYHEFVAKKA
jgi:hypothetical protein